MRFLLVSDTHGQLKILNELAERTQSDAVTHAGDFGFYDEESYGQLSQRELRLLIAHSDLPQKEKNRILGLAASEQAAAARTHGLAGEFHAFISGTESFRVPVYAVWGNHEDKDVVDRLYRNELVVPT